ncbi:MAG: SGNH/GDSL hydrolase family protein, partial [Mycoplasmataceae bacterium]|nr:SGNH/GDSL hydrolase family protein [Mycoplasmataceae bacterium]
MKYVAIGDSISAGFISNNPCDLPGELIVKNNKKKVTGLSFPAFISGYVNKMDGDFLTSFKNYAATGTRVDNWIDLVHGVDNKENEKIFGENINEYRNDFLQNLVSADHITITLGANEFIKTVFEVASSYNINKLIDKNLKIVESEYIKFKKAIVVSFNQQYNVLFKKLITKIKKINKNARIYMVSYTSPFRDADDDEKTKIKSTFGDLKPIGDFLSEINKYIKKNCEKFEIEYVDIENNKLWKENSEWTYSKIDMSHPNITGYKTIGQIVLDSMMKDESEEFKNSFNKYKKTVAYEIRYKTGLEIIHDGTIIKENISNRLVTLAGTYAELSVLFIKGFLTTTFAKKTIPTEKIRDFLFRDNDKNFTSIFEELIKNKTLVRVFNYFQTGMTMKEDDVLEEFTMTEGAEYSLLALMINIINIKEFQDKETKKELVFICLSVLDKVSHKDNEKLIKLFISHAAKSLSKVITPEIEDYIFTTWKIFALS